MNLAVNARDAMPKGGELRFELARLHATEAEADPLDGVSAGTWIKFAVADTGTGIPADVLPHIFEPFFTTKELGTGTGLGLAPVYGIVGMCEGQIRLSTQNGQGTTFTLYLPALALESLHTEGAGALLADWLLKPVDFATLSRVIAHALRSTQ